MGDGTRRSEVNLDESSVYGHNESTSPSPASADDLATEATIDRLEALAGGDEEEAPVVKGDLGQKFDELDASTEEEIDALETDLVQEDERADRRDGTVVVVDELAEERIAKLTEVGPMQGDQGVVTVDPGRDDTGSALRRHHPNT